jgi:hypothetical protein
MPNQISEIILNRPKYDVLPELLDPERLYEIKGASRKGMVKAAKDGIKFRAYIVFYGGEASNINRRDVSSIRYICGKRREVFARLQEMEFKTWMDYRLYWLIVNADFTYGKIGRPVDISTNWLLEMATFIPKRKRLAMNKKGRIWNNKHPEDPVLVKRRELFKEKVDKTVSDALKTFKK